MLARYQQLTKCTWDEARDEDYEDVLFTLAVKASEIELQNKKSKRKK
jgi:hypothetical protein